MAFTNTTVRVGEFVYDPDSGDLARNDDSQRLRPQAARALAVLIENAGQVVTRDDLQRAIWPNTTVEYDLSLNVCVRQIRAAFNDDADAPRYIETLPRRGYRLVAPVSPVASQRTINIRNFGLAAIGILVIAVIGLALALGRPDNIRIAILPIDMPQTQDSLEYIEYGVAEELISALADLDPERLSVIGKASSFGLAAQGLDPVDIGIQLDADYVLESTVRPVGDAYRATIRLLEITSDTYSWSDLVDVAAVNLSSLDQILASRITPALHDQFGIGAERQTYLAITMDPVIGEALLRSRVLLSRVTQIDAQAAVHTLQSAIDYSPSNPHLYVYLALAHLRLGALEHAEEALAHAEAIDPATRDLDHVAGQVALFGRGNASLALRHLRRAINAHSGQADVHRTYAFALVANGDPEGALKHGEIALLLDPVSSTARGDLGWLYYYGKRYTDAQRVCRSTLELTPQSLSARECVVLAAALAGRIQDATDLVPDLLNVLQATEVEISAITKDLNEGDSTSLWDWLLGNDVRFNQLSGLQQARVLSMAGRSDEALVVLNRADSANPTQILFSHWDPALLPLHDLPGYRASGGG